MRTHRVLSAQQHLGARGLTALAKAKQGSSTTEGATPSARGSSAAAELPDDVSAQCRHCGEYCCVRRTIVLQCYSATVLQCYSATVQHANSLLRIASHRIASQSVPGSGRRRRRPRRPAATTIPAVPNRNVQPIATHATPHHTTPRHATRPQAGRRRWPMRYSRRPAQASHELPDCRTTGRPGSKYCGGREGGSWYAVGRAGRAHCSGMPLSFLPLEPFLALQMTQA